MKYPIIVLTGHYGCGKSYAAKLIKSDLDIAVNLNKYDFITRWIMYVNGILPALTGYSWFSEDLLDHTIIKTPETLPILNYIKDNVLLAKGLDSTTLMYSLTTIFKCSNVNSDVLNSISDLTSFYDKMKLVYDNRKSPDLKLLFDVSAFMVDNILGAFYDWTNKLDVYKYLDTVFNPYNVVWNNYAKRIVYYAYSLHEINYMKEKYNSPVIWMDMNHVIRSNVLGASGETTKLGLLSDEAYNIEMAEMQKASTAIVKNDYDFDTLIANKIKYTINFD